MIDYGSYFKNVFLPSIETLFDVNWQSKGWGGLDNPENYPGFDEVTMSFSEISEVILSSPKQYRLTSEQERLIQKLSEMIDSYDCKEDRPKNEKEIIKDPEWDKIRIFAERVYNNLREIKF